MVYYKFIDYDTITVGQFDMQYSEFLPVPELFEKGYTWYFSTDYSQAQYYNFYFKRATDTYLFNVVVRC